MSHIYNPYSSDKRGSSAQQTQYGHSSTQAKSDPQRPSLLSPGSSYMSFPAAPPPNPHANNPQPMSLTDPVYKASQSRLTKEEEANRSREMPQLWERDPHPCMMTPHSQGHREPVPESSDRSTDWPSTYKSPHDNNAPKYYTSASSSSFLWAGEGRFASSPEMKPQSIPGLGNKEFPARETTSSQPEFSQPKYTSESASNILLQFGLDKDDLEQLLSYPDDQITPENLPFILRQIRQQKTKNAVSAVLAAPHLEPKPTATSLNEMDTRVGSKEEYRPPGILKKSKVIDYGHLSQGYGHFSQDYGHLSQVSAGLGEEQGRPSSSGVQSIGSTSMLTGSSDREARDQKSPVTGLGSSYSLNLSSASLSTCNTSMQYPPPFMQIPETSSIPFTVPPRLDTDSRLHVQKGAEPNQQKSSKPHFSDTPCQSSASGQSGIGLFDTHKDPSKPRNPMSKVPDQRKTTLQQQPARKQPTAQRSAAPQVITDPYSLQPPSGETSSSLPDPAQMHDCVSSTPRAFPHTCSLCKKECFSTKDWINHQNTTIHLENCKLLRKRFPSWDGELVSSLSAESSSSRPPKSRKSRHNNSGSRSRSRSYSPRRFRGSKSRRDQYRGRYASRSRSRSYSPRRGTGSRSHSRSYSPCQSSRKLRRSRSRSQSPLYRGSSARYRSRSRSYSRRNSPRRRDERRSSTRRSHERRLSSEQQEPTAEALAQKLLEASAGQSLSNQSGLEAVVKSLAPALLAELNKLKSSSSSAPRREPKTDTISTNPACKVFLEDVLSSVSYLNLGKAAKAFGNPTEVNIVRKYRKAWVVFEKPEEAEKMRRAKSHQILGLKVVARPGASTGSQTSARDLKKTSQKTPQKSSVSTSKTPSTSSKVECVIAKTTSKGKTPTKKTEPGKTKGAAASSSKQTSAPKPPNMATVDKKPPKKETLPNKLATPSKSATRDIKAAIPEKKSHASKPANPTSSEKKTEEKQEKESKVKNQFSSAKVDKPPGKPVAPTQLLVKVNLKDIEPRTLGKPKEGAPQSHGKHGVKEKTEAAGKERAALGKTDVPLLKAVEPPPKAAGLPLKVATGTKTDGPPLKAAEPPLKSAEPPLKAAEPPLKAATGTKTDGPPLKAAGPPLKAAEPPLKSAEPPLKAAEPPLKAATGTKTDGAPLKAAEPPLKSAEPPLKVPEPPLKVPEPPLKAAEPPLKLAEPPLKAAEPPLQAAGAPLKAAAATKTNESLLGDVHLSHGVMLGKLLLQSRISCVDIQNIYCEEFASTTKRALWISNLPKYQDNGYTERDVVRLLAPFGFRYEDENIHNIYVVPQKRMAIVILPTAGMLLNIVGASALSSLKFYGCELSVQILEDEIRSPLDFYQCLMKWMDVEMKEEDAEGLIFIKNISPSEARELREVLKKMDNVKNYAPLLNKVFIQFQTSRDADRLGVYYSLLKDPPRHAVYRLTTPYSTRTVQPPLLVSKAFPMLPLRVPWTAAPSISFGVPPGTFSPFYLTMKRFPYIFPTASPWFTVPQFTSSWLKSSSTPTVLLTSLPEEGYSHMDVARLVWPHFHKRSVYTLFYRVVVLPLQRRAFIYYHNKNASNLLARRHHSQSLSIRGTSINLHFVDKNVKPEYTEVTMYRGLMKLSGGAVPQQKGLKERLLLVEVSEVSLELIQTVMKVVTSMVQVVGFLPLANRICIELSTRSEVNLVMNANKPKPPPPLWNKVVRVYSFQSLNQRLGKLSKTPIEIEEECVSPPSAAPDQTAQNPKSNLQSNTSLTSSNAANLAQDSGSAPETKKVETTEKQFSGLVAADNEELPKAPTPSEKHSTSPKMPEELPGGSTPPKELSEGTATSKVCSECPARSEEGPGGPTTTEELSEGSKAFEEILEGPTTFQELSEGLTTSKNSSKGLTPSEELPELPEKPTTTKKPFKGPTASEELPKVLTQSEEILEGPAPSEALPDGPKPSEELPEGPIPSEKLPEGPTPSEEHPEQPTTSKPQIERENSSLMGENNMEAISAAIQQHKQGQEGKVQDIKVVDEKDLDFDQDTDEFVTLDEINEENDEQSFNSSKQQSGKSRAHTKSCSQKLTLSEQDSKSVNKSVRASERSRSPSAPQRKQRDSCTTRDRDESRSPERRSLLIRDKSRTPETRSHQARERSPSTEHRSHRSRDGSPSTERRSHRSRDGSPSTERRSHRTKDKSVSSEPKEMSFGTECKSNSVKEKSPSSESKDKSSSTDSKSDKCISLAALSDINLKVSAETPAKKGESEKQTPLKVHKEEQTSETQSPKSEKEQKEEGMEKYQILDLFEEMINEDSELPEVPVQSWDAESFQVLDSVEDECSAKREESSETETTFQVLDSITEDQPATDPVTCIKGAENVNDDNTASNIPKKPGTGRGGRRGRPPKGLQVNKAPIHQENSEVIDSIRHPTKIEGPKQENQALKDVTQSVTIKEEEVVYQVIDSVEEQSAPIIKKKTGRRGRPTRKKAKGSSSNEVTEKKQDETKTKDKTDLCEKEGINNSSCKGLDAVGIKLTQETETCEGRRLIENEDKNVLQTPKEEPKYQVIDSVEDDGAPKEAIPATRSTRPRRGRSARRDETATRPTAANECKIEKLEVTIENVAYKVIDSVIDSVEDNEAPVETVTATRSTRRQRRSAKRDETATRQTAADESKGGREASPKVEHLEVNVEEATYKVIDSVIDSVEDNEAPEEAVTATRSTRRQRRSAKRDETATTRQTAADESKGGREASPKVENLEVNVEEATYKVIDSVECERAPDDPRDSGRIRKRGRPRKVKATSKPADSKKFKLEMEEEPTYQIIDSVEEEAAKDPQISEAPETEKKSSLPEEQLKINESVFEEDEEEPVYQIVDSVEDEQAQDEKEEDSVPDKSMTLEGSTSDTDELKDHTDNVVDKNHESCSLEGSSVVRSEEAKQEEMKEVPRSQSISSREHQRKETEMSEENARELLTLDEVSADEASEEHEEDSSERKEGEDQEQLMKTEEQVAELDTQELLTLDEVGADEAPEEQGDGLERNYEKDLEKLRKTEEEVAELDTQELLTLDEVSADEAPEEHEEEHLEKKEGEDPEKVSELLTLDEVGADDALEKTKAEGPEPIEDLPMNDEGMEHLVRENLQSPDPLNSVTLATVGDKKNKVEQTDPTTDHQHHNPEENDFITLDEVREEEEEVVPVEGEVKKRSRAASGSEEGREDAVKDEQTKESQSEEEPLSSNQPISSAETGAGSQSEEGSTVATEEGGAKVQVVRKRRKEVREPEAKRSRSQSPDVPSDMTLPTYNANVPLGQEFVVPKSGFFCNVCSIFYVNERTAKDVHCSTRRHYDNLKNYYLKLKKSPPPSNSSSDTHRTK